MAGSCVRTGREACEHTTVSIRHWNCRRRLLSGGVILCRLKETAILEQFVQDAFVDDGIGLVRLQPEETKRVLELAAQFSLDFDDAYQYAAAEKFDLQLVSLDSDFDRTDRGRKSPSEILS